MDYEFRTELLNRKASFILDKSPDAKIAGFMDALSEYSQGLQDLCDIIEEARIKTHLQKTVFRKDTNRFYMVFRSSHNPRILHVF